jgi:hypothetical protein
MVATKLGVFEALADAPLTAPAVAGSCGMNERATEKILNLLVGMRYLQRRRAGEYRLTKPARTWLLESSRQSVRDMVLMKFLEWDSAWSITSTPIPTEPLRSAARGHCGPAACSSSAT